MKLVFDLDALLLWAKVRLPDYAVPIPRDVQAIGFEDNGTIIAVALYYNYQETDINITFVASTPRWASRRNIRAVLNYPFRQLGTNRLTAQTPENHKRAQRLILGVGFELEGRHPEALADGGALLTFGLLRTRAERMWFHGQKIRGIPATAARSL